MLDAENVTVVFRKDSMMLDAENVSVPKRFDLDTDSFPECFNKFMLVWDVVSFPRFVLRIFHVSKLLMWARPLLVSVMTGSLNVCVG